MIHLRQISSSGMSSISSLRLLSAQSPRSHAQQQRHRHRHNSTTSHTHHLVTRSSFTNTQSRVNAPSVRAVDNTHSINNIRGNIPDSPPFSIPSHGSRKARFIDAKLQEQVRNAVWQIKSAVHTGIKKQKVDEHEVESTRESAGYIVLQYLAERSLEAGDPHLAQEVMSMLPQHGATVKSAHLYLELAKSFLAAQELDKAWMLLKNLQTPNGEDIHAILESLCQAFVRANNIEGADSVLDKIVESGRQPNSYTYELIACAYVDGKRFSDAKILIDRMRRDGMHPRTVVYNKILGGLVRSKNMDKAEQWVQNMIHSSVSLDSNSYGALYNGYLRENQLTKALELLNKMKKEGFLPHIKMYGSLMNKYVESRNMKYALELQDMMQEHGVQLRTAEYNTLLKGMVLEKRFEDATNLLQEMQQNGVLADKITYTTLLAAYTKEKMKSEAKGIISIMNTSSSHGSIGNGQNIGIEGGRLKHDIRWYDALIKFSDADQSMAILQQMRSPAGSLLSSSPPSALSPFSSTLPTDSSPGSVNAAASFADTSTENNAVSDVNPHSSLASGANTDISSHTNTAAGFTAGVGTDVVAYMNAAVCQVKGERYDRLPVLVMHMRQDGVKPSFKFYDFVIECCAQQENAQLLMTVFRMMREDGIAVTRTLSWNVLGCLARNRKTELYSEVLAAMQACDISPQFAEYRLMINSYLGTDNERVRELLQELEARSAPHGPIRATRLRLRYIARVKARIGSTRTAPSLTRTTPTPIPAATP